MNWLERWLLSQAVKRIENKLEDKGMGNIKTTAIGIIGAIANSAYPLITKGNVPPETIIVSVIIALLGFFAKDYNVSGTGQ
jgi:uncharacterized membrane protein YeaQ/YmgE (transglycosylase-associated protein family)